MRNLPGCLVNRADRLVGQRPGRAASAVGYRDKIRLERAKGIHTVPKPERAFEVLGREEFERKTCA